MITFYDLKSLAHLNLQLIYKHWIISCKLDHFFFMCGISILAHALSIFYFSLLTLACGLSILACGMSILVECTFWHKV
jgi:hypothetical protein